MKAAGNIFIPDWERVLSPQLFQDMVELRIFDTLENNLHQKKRQANNCEHTIDGIAFY